MKIVVASRLLICCCGLAAPMAHASVDAPPLMLAESLAADQLVTVGDYWISEKLDGVRAYWDGKQLLTRAGHVIHAPDWFTAHFPLTPLDGELWGGRGEFETTSATVRSTQASDVQWRRLSFRAFDLPDDPNIFDKRLEKLQRIVVHAGSQWLFIVDQYRVESLAQLQVKLKEIEALGGEGLMLHRGGSHYAAGRTEDLLKFKSFADAEARVIGYAPGNGKYVGMMGALVVERADGVRFKIGSGFSDDERVTPPPIGAWITYAYNGLTENGLPRFARFMRLRPDHLESK